MADLRVEAGVLQHDAGLVRHGLSQGQLPLVQRRTGSREQLDRSDGLAVNDDRQLNHDRAAEIREKPDFAGVGGGIGRNDDRRLLRQQDASCFGVLDKRIDVVEEGSPIGREVARGPDRVVEPVPRVDPTLIKVDGLRDVRGDQVGEPVIVECLREIAAHRDEALQLASPISDLVIQLSRRPFGNCLSLVAGKPLPLEPPPQPRDLRIRRSIHALHRSGRRSAPEDDHEITPLVSAKHAARLSDRRLLPEPPRCTLDQALRERAELSV